MGIGRKKIPSEWTIKPLEEVVEKIIDYRGKTPKKLGGDWSIHGEYRALSAKSVKTGGLVNEDQVKRVDEDLYQKWMKDEVQRDDILLTSEAPMGEVLIWESDEKIVLSQRLFAIRAKEEVSPKYLYYFFTSRYFQAELTGRQSGSTVSGIRQTELVRTKIILPEKKEQDAIASALSIYDDKANLLMEQNRTLEKIAQTLFKSWFIDYNFPDDNGDPYMKSGGKFKLVDGASVPANWEFGKLGDIATNIRKGVNASDISSDFNYIGLEHMPRKSIAILDWGSGEGVASNKFEFKTGDILFGKLRPYFHKVGIAPIDGVCSTDILVVNQIEPEDYGQVLCTLCSESFVRYTTITSQGTRMPRTDWNVMSDYAVPLPPQHIASSFTDIVKEIANKIHLNVQEIRNLEAVKESLLPKLMSGEVRVSV